MKQVDAGTQASATAFGKYGKGTAKTQVGGTYTGSGSFSAQAGTSDGDKSAQAEVNAGKEGATSNSQSSGGRARSQTQVQLNTDSGATMTQAQTTGWNHGTNSQVQASEKGGMADAQSQGEGNTSSQAQIGFQPYVKKDEKLEKHAKPFRGGGSATAQSGTFRGQSQTQLQGAFQYGINYSGAAQATSGSGPKRNVNLSTNNDLFKAFKPLEPLVISKDEERVTTVQNDEKNVEQEKLTSVANKEVSMSSSMSSKQVDRKPARATEESAVVDNSNDEYEEYDEEDYDSKAKLETKQINKQKSRIVHFAREKDKILQPGQSYAGLTVPVGFRGRLITNDEKKSSSVSSGTRSLHVYKAGDNNRPKSDPTKPNYFTVTNSVAGKLDDNNKDSAKQYEHRYYSKSSTCGYFTFSCNLVYGSNGRTKICKPKVPTNADGTPVQC